MAYRRLPLLCWVAMCVLFASHPLFSQTYTSDVQNGISELQTFYSPSTGIYTVPGWWHSANALTVLSNYERTTNDNTLYSTILNSFNVAAVANHHPNYENFYYDDTGWWTLAWIQAYDLTGDASYLSQAETTFNGFLVNGWNPATCGGGEYWAINSNYKNAIANELFLTVAAKLANRTSGSDSATYLSWANKEWTWFKNSGTINSSNLINDGITPPTANPPCANNGGTTWTYNQGVVLDGLVELAQANNDPSLITEAQTLAHATLTSSLVNSNGILVETSIAGGDAPGFKGIFARNLMYLNDAVNNPAYTSFFNTNANSIWTNDQGPSYELGGLWQGPFDTNDDGTRLSSALDAIVGAVDAQPHSSAGPIDTDTAGSQEMFAVDGSGNVWQDAQIAGSHGASASSNWTGWTEFPTGVTAHPGAVVAENGIREEYVFAPSAGDVYVISESNPAGDWGSWTDMGAGSSGMTDLQAIYTYNGGLYLFGLNKSGNLSYASLSSPNASWTTFAPLTGETVQSGYTVAKNAVTGYLQVFGVDAKGSVWTNVQTGLTTWSGWSQLPMGNPLQGYLAVAQDRSGNLHVFGIGNDAGGNVWTNYQSANGSWQSVWQQLGFPQPHNTIHPGFVCGINANGALELFGVANDGNLYSLSQVNGVWSSTWANLGGAPLNPTLVLSTTADGRLQIFGTSGTGSNDVYSDWQTSASGSWNGWEDFGGSGYSF